MKRVGIFFPLLGSVDSIEKGRVHLSDYVSPSAVQPKNCGSNSCSRRPKIKWLISWWFWGGNILGVDQTRNKIMDCKNTEDCLRGIQFFAGFICQTSSVGAMVSGPRV